MSAEKMSSKKEKHAIAYCKGPCGHPRCELVKCAMLEHGDSFAPPEKKANLFPKQGDLHDCGYDCRYCERCKDFHNVVVNHQVNNIDSYICYGRDDYYLNPNGHLQQSTFEKKRLIPPRGPVVRPSTGAQDPLLHNPKLTEKDPEPTKQPEPVKDPEPSKDPEIVIASSSLPLPTEPVSSASPSGTINVSNFETAVKIEFQNSPKPAPPMYVKPDKTKILEWDRYTKQMEFRRRLWKSAFLEVLRRFDGATTFNSGDLSIISSLKNIADGHELSDAVLAHPKAGILRWRHAYVARLSEVINQLYEKVLLHEMNKDDY